MFESVPSETMALRTLLADLHDDLAGRVDRLRLLLALEADFGSGRRLMIPGGTPAYAAYVETRQAFVLGNFLSVVLLSQCVLENILAAQLGLNAMSAEIRGGTPKQQKLRPEFREIVAACKASNMLTQEDERDLFRLADFRNALAHFRTVNDPSHLDRRAISERRPASMICEDDARFAITLFVRILAKPAFRLDENPL
jgi:hypothetical protein